MKRVKISRIQTKGLQIKMLKIKVKDGVRRGLTQHHGENSMRPTRVHVHLGTSCSPKGGTSSEMRHNVVETRALQFHGSRDH